MSDLHTHYIDVLRHGECEGGAIFRGSSNVALTEHGLKTMHTQAKQLHTEHALIVSSPLQRCRIFAQQWAKKQNVQCVIEHGFRELHFGDWEGLSTDKVWQNNQSDVDAWYLDPASFTPPNGEHCTDFFTRTQAAFTKLLAHKNKNILLVTHAGVIRMLLANVLSMPLSATHNMAIPFGCITRFSVTRFNSDTPFIQLHAHNLFNSLPQSEQAK